MVSQERFLVDGPTFEIERLPPEIRILIFREYMVESGEAFDGRTPLLVKALRSAPQMYEEALEAWYYIHTCVISTNNRHEVGSMPSAVLRRAQSLRVFYGLRLSKNPWNLNLEFTCSPDVLSQCRNVRTLHIGRIEYNAWEKETEVAFELVSLLRTLLIAAPSLETLFLDVGIRMAVGIEGHQFSEFLKRIDAFTLIMPAIEINKFLGLQHRWTLHNSHDAFTLRWKADKGRVLTWTDWEYFRSVPRRIMPLRIFTLHGLISWSDQQFHFLGLQPQKRLHTCPKRPCSCENSMTEGWPHIRDSTLSNDKGFALLDEKSDVSAYTKSGRMLRNRPHRTKQHLYYRDGMLKIITVAPWSKSGAGSRSWHQRTVIGTITIRRRDSRLEPVA